MCPPSSLKTKGGKSSCACVSPKLIKGFATVVKRSAGRPAGRAHARWNAHFFCQILALCRVIFFVCHLKKNAFFKKTP